MTTDPLSHSGQKKRTRLRRCSVLIAAVILHVIAISWFSDTLVFPITSSPENSTVITATIEAEPPKPVIKAAAPTRTTKPRIAKSPTSAPKIAPTIAPEIIAAPDEAKRADESTAQQAAESIPTDPSVISYNIDLPPSANLKYDVQKNSKDSSPMYGSGNIRWHTDGNTYTVDGNFGVLFISALRFQSKGTIDDIGISPELYSEKRFRKAETNTHFHRERNTISFSSSTQTYPRTGGEQDRASIVWQLAAIGRGDSGKFVAGSSIDLFVAGTRSAETWKIMIIGEEDIAVDGVSTRAWHVARAPRSGSYDQVLDIWLAPDQNWYPVRLRYTEANGDYLDMTLSSLSIQ